jgi:hypothetical protein
MANGKISKTAVDALKLKRRADGSFADTFLWDTHLIGRHDGAVRKGNPLSVAHETNGNKLRTCPFWK